MQHPTNLMAVVQIFVSLLGIGLDGDVLAIEESVRESPDGVVVVEVADGSTLAKAGLRPGDILLSWERHPNPPANPERGRGKITSVFDWMWLVIEQAPRATMRLIGEREGKEVVFEVARGLWDTKIRPRMPEEALRIYLQGKNLIEAGQLREGISTWQEDTRMDDRNHPWHRRCFILLRIGEAWSKAKAWGKADAVYQSALAESRDPVSKVTIWEAIGKNYRQQNRFEEATATYLSALELQEGTWGESLNVASSRNKLGLVAWYRGQLDLAEKHWQEALQIRERLAPGSLQVASIMNNLGSVAWARHEVDQAADYYRRTLEIEEKLAPNSLEVAYSLTNLGNVARFRGELELAADYHQQALKIKQKLAPNSLAVAMSFNSLAFVAHYRGELNLAEKYHQRALDIQEHLAPNSLDVASSLNNLGYVFQHRGELELAREYYQRALKIRENLAPSSLVVAKTLNNLGSLARYRGELSLAEEFFQRALEIREKLAPDSYAVAASLNDLGNIAQDRGALKLAAEYYERTLEIGKEMGSDNLALAAGLGNLANVATLQGKSGATVEYYRNALRIAEKLTPGGLASASALHNLGTFFGERGELELAMEHFRRALEIRKKLAPNSLWAADTLQNLGELYRKNSQIELAAQYFDRAIETLEGQIGKLGGSQDVKGRFRAGQKLIYQGAANVQLKLKEPEKAFHITERFRGQSFLAMLAERDLIFSTDIPEELETARRRIAVRYDRTLVEMAELSTTNRHEEEKIEALLREQRRLGRDRDEVAARIRKTAPRLAALQYPKALEAQEVQENLESGTVMLSYSVGKEETQLFVVKCEENLRVHSIPIGEQQLRAEVERFHHLIPEAMPASRIGRVRLPELEMVSRRLYETLVEPADESLEKSDRLVIVADGPLHLIPFGALIRGIGEKEDPAARNWQYLVEWKPMHSVLSATVYAQLKKSRREAGQPGVNEPAVKVVAFGDPSYPKDVTHANEDRISDVRVRSAVHRRLFDWTSLPYSRREIEGISEFYPAQSVQTYLGEEATEERAKSIGRDARVLHFATHGYLDDRFPLNSGLALTIPEGFPEDRENGLLQAWEIFGQIRIDADLVVLSACQTALGEEQGGEGLIGLTRAFQYAGARSVLASLWSVHDQATAELMVRFYRHHRAGKPKDEALRAAQMELIRGPIQVENEAGESVEMDASAPYYWAAFQLIGDWH